ncbi:TrmB family transcriptional regulator [Halosimplex litoreum]|uniref:TrmB family transcriptional regulator n=1 Tax=Halosimplex litoreum TaxID=1198301 RepID=A0A7T3FVL2_9EURY|nr:TrmB family transcriptional regulator [Halosimplex litoreum]QPV61502.1 TrmB family transcriptional regulator [Halosimplex litoreum]
METKRLREALERAGLTEYQAAVYLGLLDRGTSPVVDVAERAGVPTSQVYDVVRTLEDRGFVETIERDRLHARADEPGDVLDELRSTGQLLATAADEIEDRWERPDPSEHRVSVVKRRRTVVENARAAIEDAEVSVEFGGSAAQFAELRPALAAAAERGVVVHASVNGPVADTDVSAERLANSPITEVRHSHSPGSFLTVVDRRQGFLSPNVHADEEYGVQVGDDLLTFLFHWSFLTCGWVPADRVHVADPDETAYISIEEFVRNAAVCWSEGATVAVAVRGRDTDTGDPVEIRGDLVDVRLGPDNGAVTDPTYDQLGGTVSIVVATDDGEVAVGGWGAVTEDVEAEVVRVEGVTE